MAHRRRHRSPWFGTLQGALTACKVIESFENLFLPKIAGSLRLLTLDLLMVDTRYTCQNKPHDEECYEEHNQERNAHSGIAALVDIREPLSIPAKGIDSCYGKQSYQKASSVLGPDIFIKKPCDDIGVRLHSRP